MEEKSITISVTEDEMRLWRQFMGEIAGLGLERDWPGIARNLRKKIEKELEKLE